MKIAVIAPQVPKNIKELINIDEYLIYACDSAVSDLVSQNIKIDLAIGDFDSLQDQSLLVGLKTIKLSKEKDFSDTNYAINHAFNHSEEVILIGGIKGSRIDHFIANVLLLETYNNLVILDDSNKIFLLEEGSYDIYKEDYTYLTVFPITNTFISLEGTKYTLKNKFLKAKDQLGLSNEIINDKAIISILDGKVLIIQSK